MTRVTRWSPGARQVGPRPDRRTTLALRRLWHRMNGADRNPRVHGGEGVNGGSRWRRPTTSSGESGARVSTARSTSSGGGRSRFSSSSRTAGRCPRRGRRRGVRRGRPCRGTACCPDEVVVMVAAGRGRQAREPEQDVVALEEPRLAVRTDQDRGRLPGVGPRHGPPPSSPQYRCASRAVPIAFSPMPAAASSEARRVCEGGSPGWSHAAWRSIERTCPITVAASRA